MRVCLRVLNIVLHLFLLVLACFWRNKEENILLANFVPEQIIVRNNKRFFVSLPVFVIQLVLLARSLKEEIWKWICTANIGHVLNEQGTGYEHIFSWYKCSISTELKMGHVI